MGIFRFHLVGPSDPIELEVAAPTISDLCEEIGRNRFVEGKLAEPNEDGVLLGMLIATSRIECVVERG